MTDISKCSGDTCGIREKCYRFKARLNPYRQSWIKGEEKDGECKLFYKIPK